MADFLSSYLSDANESKSPANKKATLHSPTPQHDVSDRRLNNLKKGNFSSMRQERKQFFSSEGKIRFMAPIETEETLQPVYLTPKAAIDGSRREELEPIPITPRDDKPNDEWDDLDLNPLDQKDENMKEEKEPSSLFSMFKFLRKPSK